MRQKERSYEFVHEFRMHAQFYVGHAVCDLLSPVKGVDGEKGKPGPRKGAVPYKADSLLGDVGQKADEDRLLDIEMSAKTPGDKDSLEVSEIHLEGFEQHPHSRKYRPLALDEIADVILRDYDRPPVAVSSAGAMMNSGTSSTTCTLGWSRRANLPL